MTEVVSIERDGADATRAALERALSSGGVVVFPADTLYGLGCDPLDPDAIARIHRLKGRDDGKSSAVLYFSALALRELLPGTGPRTRAALAALLPGPVTLVIDNPERRYPLACREDPARLGIRLIEGPLAGAMSPVFQTSANLTGAAPPSRFEAIDPGILAGVDVAIDGGELGGAPSTVIDVASLDSGGAWSVLREGALSASEVESRLGGIDDAGDPPADR